ncbi:8-oxo-dGTP diphosphatase [Actinopolymorpha rutila]|uniref:8-oxo-dGTP diphosphatase n=2 Tax=Actinopolymorpha rutila TaxID=446787 RepID=A0A852Z719_9ACTN|nr:8-oxo-dGTP diphosphatase [Actinopolymorpha rutila]
MNDMPALPVRNADGSALLSFERLAEADLAGLDPSVPLTASLVVLRHGDTCLMVFNRFRQLWELPGGMIDPGETPLVAAVRELEEESAQRPDKLDLAGVARVTCAPDDRHEFLAIYRGCVDTPLPFVPNTEMSDATWWHPARELRALTPIDAALAHLCPAQ